MHPPMGEAGRGPAARAPESRARQSDGGYIFDFSRLTILPLRPEPCWLATLRAMVSGLKDLQVAFGQTQDMRVLCY